ncbi:Phosphoribosyl transferase domain-containing protein [Desulfurella multipotens]|uniref:Phosphoribosyl transferase domain-containing protein n=1 Tax=Desulfurella multipotens TaxID=79269 RepID=A0A1G6HVR5_9BACT|nr:phosphoribosyltransferase family protein [Desulfurella multipotens]SDB98352.1 Phosphoribosyl transferase domain-containing protein [Desulfurella multipotens]
MKFRFKNRQEAGIELAKKLKDYIDEKTIILALPRGGVSVASSIAKALNIDFNIYISKKIPHPDNEEFAIGAMGEFGEIIIDPFFSSLITNEAIKETKNKIESYIKQYRKKPIENLDSKTVILVDDGIATGLSMEAAIKDIQKLHPKKIIVAAPVIAEDTFEKLNKIVPVIALIVSSDPFFSVGMYYEDFHQLSDQEVEEIISDEQ